MPLTFEQFQNQIESASGFTDWKYSGEDCDYPCYRAYRNNGQFNLTYSKSEYHYDWNAERRSHTTKVSRDCFVLKDAIVFLSMPRVARYPVCIKKFKQRQNARNLGFTLIGMSIGWMMAVLTLMSAPTHQSVYAPTASTEGVKSP